MQLTTPLCEALRWATPALPVQAGEHSEATRQHLQTSRDAGAQLGLTRKRIQRMNPMSIWGDDWLLQTGCGYTEPRFGRSKAVSRNRARCTVRRST